MIKKIAIILGLILTITLFIRADQVLASPFGPITMPSTFKYGDLSTGLVSFLNNVLRLLTVIAGLFVLFNLIMAGYGFISAGDDPKKIQSAWSRIWQSIIGLLIVAGAFVLAAIFSYLLFGNVTTILQPKIYGP
jgi:hypothetical protein